MLGVAALAALLAGDRAVAALAAVSSSATGVLGSSFEPLLSLMLLAAAVIVVAVAWRLAAGRRAAAAVLLTCGLLAPCTAAVTAASTPVSVRLSLPDVTEICPDGAETCLMGVYEEVARVHGFDVAVRAAALERDRDPDGPMAVSCHSVLHRLGRTLMSNSVSLALALNAGKPYMFACTGGFVHGIIEQGLRDFSRSELQHVAPELCSSVAEPRSAMNELCSHVLGHALVASAGIDWLDALRACLVVDSGSEMCWSGGFMQHFIDPAHLEEVSANGARKEATAPCGDLPADFPLTARQYCMLEASPQLYKTVGADPADAFSVCDEQSEPETLNWCEMGVGKAVALWSHNDPGQLIRTCQKAGDRCLFWGARMLANVLTRASAGEEVCAAIADTSRVEACRTAARQAATVFDNRVSAVFE